MVCPSLKAPENGDVKVISDGSTTTASFTCDPAHSLEGNSKLTCRSNGIWDHPQPLCRTCLFFSITSLNKFCFFFLIKYGPHVKENVFAILLSFAKFIRIAYTRPKGIYAQCEDAHAAYIFFIVFDIMRHFYHFLFAKQGINNFLDH